MKMQKIDKKKLLIKSMEVGVRKSFELAVLGIALGVSTKAIALTIPAAMAGCFYSQSSQADAFRLGELK